jgi:hypothetical protein
MYSNPIPVRRDNEGMKAGALKTDMAGLSYKNTLKGTEYDTIGRDR